MQMEAVRAAVKEKLQHFDFLGAGRLCRIQQTIIFAELRIGQCRSADKQCHRNDQTPNQTFHVSLLVVIVNTLIAPASEYYPPHFVSENRAHDSSHPHFCTAPNAHDTTHPVSYTHLRAHETRHDLVCR